MPRTTHGLTNTPEFRSWTNMIGRCHCTTHRAYRYYGARGIAVCDRWRNSFENFIADMGKRPSPKHTLERSDNDKGYEPSNCRWATRKEQQNNRSNTVLLTFAGKTQTISSWSAEVGISPAIIQNRYTRGWSADRILTVPRRKYPERIEP